MSFFWRLLDQYTWFFSRFATEPLMVASMLTAQTPTQVMYTTNAAPKQKVLSVTKNRLDNRFHPIHPLTRSDESQLEFRQRVLNIRLGNTGDDYHPHNDKQHAANIRLGNK